MSPLDVWTQSSVFSTWRATQTDSVVRTRTMVARTTMIPGRWRRIRPGSGGRAAAVECRLQLGLALVAQRGLQDVPAVLADLVEDLVGRGLAHEQDDRGAALAQLRAELLHEVVV